jgi:hypothetical protein
MERRTGVIPTMSATLVFVLIAFVLLLSFAYLATRRTRDLPDVDQALTAIRALDIEAFRNLVDPEEEAFLRARLPIPEFKKIKRERTRAALAYVRALASVSLQFARFGDAARRSPDPVIAASGKQIADSAVYLRLLALDAGAKLTLSAAFPSLDPHRLRSLLHQYDRATYLLVQHDVLKRAHSRAA